MIAASRGSVPIPSIFEKIHTLAVVESGIGDDSDCTFEDVKLQMCIASDGFPNWFSILTSLKTLLLIKDYNGVTSGTTDYPPGLVEFTNRGDQASPNLAPFVQMSNSRGTQCSIAAVTFYSIEYIKEFC
jgi:hypothetical protein